MVWLGIILAMIWAQSVQGWSEWGFRITVLSSLGANLVVGILSGTRRRLAFGRWWGWLGQLAKFCLWLAFQVAEAATTSAIGSLSLCGSDASSEEKQVVAFWATFLLLHLGGPDNLTAYALEDNKISSRKWLEIISRILAVIYTIYSNTHRWSLLPAASVAMLLAGAVRYIETAIALGKANLDSMQEDATSSSSEDDFKLKMDLLKSRIKRAKRRGRWLSDREALLLAQDLFPIWRHALVDSSVDPTSPRQEASEMILSSESDEREWTWECMCKVAEMELSLIYDFLYTKAILAHAWTWGYYLIRLLSPLFTAAAAFLFCLWLQQQQQGVRGSFVGITYALLAITLLMDVAWLLRALGSTWAYAYLQDQAPDWLRHQALHASSRWWCNLHRIVVRLDPLQLFRRDPVSHRRWSGTIGSYNLLEECTATATTTTCCCQRPEWWPWSEAGGDRPKEMRYLSKLPQCVKKLLFKRVTEILQEAMNTKENKMDKKMYTRLDMRTQWGRKAWSRAVDEGKIKLPSIDQDSSISGQEFEEDVLLWHIATCMVLPHRQQGKHARAIEALSEYMMFLVAVRRQMLPGLVLHSQLQITRKKLVEKMALIWAHAKFLPDQKSMTSNKEKLAMILKYLRTEDDTEKQPTDEKLLLHAVELYFSLSGEERPGDTESGAARWPPPQIADENLELIFNVWVDKLVYAAVRCSREAHAKQLSAGGDLTTVLWMLIQHAGPFSMGEAPPNVILRPPPMDGAKKKPADEEKKKKEAEEKKDEDKAKAKAKAKDKDKKKAEDKKPDDPLPAFPPPTMAGIPPWTVPHPMAPCPPPYCPMCPPCYHPSYPPVCPPYYDPSWPPVCPWCAQYPPQHAEAGDEPDEAREDEHEDSSSSSESQE